MSLVHPPWLTMCLIMLLRAPVQVPGTPYLGENIEGLDDVSLHLEFEQNELLGQPVLRLPTQLQHLPVMGDGEWGRCRNTSNHIRTRPGNNKSEEPMGMFQSAAS